MYNKNIKASELKITIIDFDGISIIVYVSRAKREIWLSRKEIAKLYNKGFATITRYINTNSPTIDIINNSKYVCKNENDSFSNENELNYISGRKQLIYNQVILYFLDEKIGVKSGKRLFEKCFEKYVENTQISQYKIVRYNQGKFEIDVRVSPNEETIWMTQEQIALLFDTSQPNISMHINNILNDEELDVSVYKDFLYTASDGKTYSVTLFNLDMILSIGYRVKSSKAIEFRKWATKILKEYMINGYAIDEDRISKVEFEQALMSNRIYEIENRLNEIDEKHILFYKDRSIDAYAFLLSKVDSARKNIIYIDPYADSFTLRVLSNKERNIPAIVVGSSNSKISEEQLEIFKRENGELSFIKNNNNHDRYLIIDEKVCFEIGSSLNSLGYYDIHVTKNLDIDFIKKLISEYVTK